MSRITFNSDSNLNFRWPATAAEEAKPSRARQSAASAAVRSTRSTSWATTATSSARPPRESGCWARRRSADPGKEAVLGQVYGGSSMATLAKCPTISLKQLMSNITF